MKILSGGLARALAVALPVALLAAAGVRADVVGRRTVDLPLLLDLPGDLAPVRYTPGALDRAASVQARFELLNREFARTRFKARAVVFYVLSPEDWAAAGLANGFGEPQALGSDALVLPAWADDELIGRVKRWLGGEVPQSPGCRLATRRRPGRSASRISWRRSPARGFSPGAPTCAEMRRGSRR
jgi:hypothetical protein